MRLNLLQFDLIRFVCLCFGFRLCSGFPSCAVNKLETTCTLKKTTRAMPRQTPDKTLDTVPCGVEQGLMMIKGVAVFLDPNITQQHSLALPSCLNVVSGSKRTHRAARSLFDKQSIVTMVPKDAILLTLLVDSSQNLFLSDHDQLTHGCENSCDDEKNHAFKKKHAFSTWWTMSLQGLQIFNLKQVLVPNTIVHAWLYMDREEKLCMGVFDISYENNVNMKHVPVVERSRHLHALFSQAVKQNVHMCNLSWVWVGELGHDEHVDKNSDVFIAACGACDVIRQGNWCFDIDYLLKFPHNNAEVYELLDATSCNKAQLTQAHKKQKIAQLRIKVDNPSHRKNTV